jgi:hypothetical protein
MTRGAGPGGWDSPGAFCASPAFRRSGGRRMGIPRRAEAIVDEGRATRLSDGAVILCAALVVVLVGVLVTLQTQAQSARTKAVAEARPTPMRAGPLFAAAAVGDGGGASRDMAQFRQLPRCVKRGVLLAAAEDQRSLPRERPPCWRRRDQMPVRPLPQARWRGAGPGHSWNDGPEPATDGFADDSD